MEMTEEKKFARVAKISVPEIDKYYNIYLCAEETGFITSEKPILYVHTENPDIKGFSAGRIPTNAYIILKDYAIYETDDGKLILIPLNSAHKVEGENQYDFLEKAASVASELTGETVVVYKALSHAGRFIGSVLEISQNPYLLFEAVPKKQDPKPKWKRKVAMLDFIEDLVEFEEIEGFWEILSCIYASDGKTHFLFKLNL